ncbi:MAG: site-2 protease family protein [Chloroflexi bacterium]|nr:site-2 protease family protein [Chloroflexota bacterium]
MNQDEQEITENQSTESAASKQLIVVAQLRRELTDFMRVDSHIIQNPPDEVIAFRGQIDGDTEAAFEHITEQLASLGYTAMLNNAQGGGHEIVAVKGEFNREPGKAWVNVVLFLVTLFSILYIGALGELDPQMVQGLADAEVMMLPLNPRLLWKGLPFAGTLMSILLTHELSHYFVARRHGSPTSLPYFIPFPNIFGTMGAVIVQRKPTRDRKALLDIGAAGPLGGLIVAIPLLVLGLLLSDVQPPPVSVDTVLQEGNSLLYLGIKYLIFGRILPSNGEDVWLHPVAFAAWGGLWLTMMNLVPVGQLDGGHVSYALLGGRRAQTLSRIAVIAMIAWGGWLLVSGNQAGGIWLTWGFMNMFFNPHHPPPLNDVTVLDRRRIVLGLLVLVIFILLFMPAPLKQVQL